MTEGVSLSKMVAASFPPHVGEERAPPPLPSPLTCFPISEPAPHPHSGASVVGVLASGKSQELTQTVPFWEKVLAKMVAKQLQGHLSPVMISLFFPPF